MADDAMSAILDAANLYATGLQAVLDRREHWLNQYEHVRDRLKAIADLLNQQAQYKQGFYVDTLHAFNETNKGTTSRIPSLVFRSGAMPMLITFRNSMGEKKAYEEEGFRISFAPTVTGQVIVLLQPHYSDMDAEPPEIITLAVIDEPGNMTDEVTDEIITRGLTAAFYTSFTGMASGNEDEKPAAARTPIGFARYETTEKVV